jgi:hypothetical protein
MDGDVNRIGVRDGEEERMKYEKNPLFYISN